MPSSLPVNPPVQPRRDSHWIGLGLYLTCLLFMVLISMVVKLTGERVPLNQILLFRFAGSLVPLWLIAAIQHRHFTLRTRRYRDHIIRTLVGIASIGMYFLAINHIPLAAATALSYAAPIFCVVLAIPILGELIGIRRWCAAIVGFIGVLVISWPGGGVWDIGSLAAIGSAVGGAMVNIYLRKLSDTESALTISIFYNSTGALLFIVWTLLVGWVPMQNADLGWLVLLGLVAGFQQFSLASAFRYAEVSFLAPFEYLILVFAAGAGYLFWGEMPAMTTWIGGLIIAGSGIFMLHRQKTRHETVQEPQASN